MVLLLSVAAVLSLVLLTTISHAWIVRSDHHHHRGSSSIGRPRTATCDGRQQQQIVGGSSTRGSTRNVVILEMGSKAASKWEKKQAWLEERGYNADGTPKTPPAEIIGGSGRIGSLLASAGNCVVVGRDDSIDPNGSGPIIICTRNDALDGIVDSCPENRKGDLVFVQNGYLDEFLESKGCSDNTQALLYLSVTGVGVEPVDGITSVNPEGLTAATGKHAQALADRLASLNLKCNVVDAASYRPAMFEKLIWIATYMLVGTAKECSSVGQAGSEHKELVENVINELVEAVKAKEEGIEFEEGTIERLAAYTDVVTDFPCAVKEFPWRNRYFYNLGDDAVPTHNGLLRECAEKGFLSFDLPAGEQQGAPEEEAAQEEETTAAA